MIKVIHCAIDDRLLLLKAYNLKKINYTYKCALSLQALMYIHNDASSYITLVMWQFIGPLTMYTPRISKTEISAMYWRDSCQGSSGNPETVRDDSHNYNNYVHPLNICM